MYRFMFKHFVLVCQHYAHLPTLFLGMKNPSQFTASYLSTTVAYISTAKSHKAVMMHDLMTYLKY